MKKYYSRKSIRLKGYDYSQSGAYFITICTHNRQHLFGNIENEEMILNDAGEIAFNEWMKTSEIRKNIVLDEFVVMPNHIHGIIIIDNDINGTGVLHTPVLHTQTNQFNSMGVCNTPLRSPSKTIGAMVRGYKSSVNKQINQLYNLMHESIWQRNYYEHIIRNDVAYQNISNYIRNNPKKWNNDRFR